MLKLLVYLMFFPIIIAFKMMGWIVKGILGIFKMMGWIVKGILGIFKMIGVADFFWKL